MLKLTFWSLYYFDSFPWFVRMFLKFAIFAFRLPFVLRLPFWIKFLYFDCHFGWWRLEWLWKEAVHVWESGEVWRSLKLQSDKLEWRNRGSKIRTSTKEIFVRNTDKLFIGLNAVQCSIVIHWYLYHICTQHMIKSIFYINICCLVAKMCAVQKCNMEFWNLGKRHEI